MILQLDIAKLAEDYNAGISASKLAQKYNVSVWTILNRLRKHDVRIRTFIEQNEKHLNLTKDQTNRFVEIVDGLVISDANIHRKKNYLQISQNGHHIPWLFQIQTFLKDIGCESKLTDIPPRIRNMKGRKIHGKAGKVLYTPAYVEFRNQRKRWYPKGTKIVPEDIKLTPLLVALWLCGDGTNDKKGGITFCTNSFSLAELELLSLKFKSDLNIEAKIDKAGRINEYYLRIKKRNESFKLKEIIQEFIPKCLSINCIT